MTWALALAYAVHILSTVMWLGAVLSLFDMDRTLPRTPNDPAAWLRGYRTYVRLAWMAAAFLWATGMFQMSKHPLYTGLLDFATPWAKALLLKHVLVLVWMAFLAFQYLVQLPRWERWELAFRAGKAGRPWESLRAEIRRGFRVQQVLALLVLVVTAWLRAQA